MFQPGAVGMSKFLSRLIAAIIATLALLFGGRAMWMLSALWSFPPPFLPAPRGTDGCPICPPTTIFGVESEQIIIILGSLMTLVLARLLWRRAA
jgi:hypothetical protein